MRVYLIIMILLQIFALAFDTYLGMYGWAILSAVNIFGFGWFLKLWEE